VILGYQTGGQKGGQKVYFHVY